VAARLLQDAAQRDSVGATRIEPGIAFDDLLDELARRKARALANAGEVAVCGAADRWQPTECGYRHAVVLRVLLLRGRRKEKETSALEPPLAPLRGAALGRDPALGDHGSSRTFTRSSSTRATSWVTTGCRGAPTARINAGPSFTAAQWAFIERELRELPETSAVAAPRPEVTRRCTSASVCRCRVCWRAGARADDRSALHAARAFARRGAQAAATR
jgi:hypothetical protein